MKKKKKSSWVVTFTDMLSLLITMFITIYALTTDHKKTHFAKNAQVKTQPDSNDSVKNTEVYETIDTSFADYIATNLSSKLSEMNATISQESHSIVIKIPEYKIFDKGQLNEDGKFAISSIQRSWIANPPSSVEISVGGNDLDSLRMACIMADFMLNFVEKLDTIKCMSNHTQDNSKETKITLME